jgi:hypothetical protein
MREIFQSISVRSIIYSAIHLYYAQHQPLQRHQHEHVNWNIGVAAFIVGVNNKAIQGLAVPRGATFHFVRVEVDPIQFTTILDGVLAVPTGMLRSCYL